MEKTYTVEFSEQAKGVVARTKIEGSSDNIDEFLEEAKTLFSKAHAYAHQKTIDKALGTLK